MGGGTRVGNQEREEVAKTSTSRQSEDGGGNSSKKIQLA